MRYALPANGSVLRGHGFAAADNTFGKTASGEVAARRWQVANDRFAPKAAIREIDILQCEGRRFGALRTVLPFPTYSSSREAGMREFLTVLAIFISDIRGRFRRWLTFRRVLGIVVVLTILLNLGILMSAGIDVFFLLGLDFGLLMEVSALLIALTVRGHVMTAVYVARGGLLRLKPFGLRLRRGVRRAIRSRSRQSLLPPPPDDEPAEWAFAMAW